MALLKEISTNFGIDAEYWKVVDLNCNWLTKTSHISLLGWATEQARRDGLQPLAQRSFDWSGDDFDFDVTKNLVEQVYTKIIDEVIVDEEGNETPGEFADAESDV